MIYFTRLTPNPSYTNTPKVTWIKPLLKTIQSVYNSYLIPLFEAKKTKKKNKKQKNKNKKKTPIYLAHEIIYYRLTHTYLPRFPSPFIINLCSYYQFNAYSSKKTKKQKNIYISNFS